MSDKRRRHVENRERRRPAREERKRRQRSEYSRAVRADRRAGLADDGPVIALLATSLLASRRGHR
jgi:hypothetical protein